MSIELVIAIGGVIASIIGAIASGGAAAGWIAARANRNLIAAQTTQTVNNGYIILLDQYRKQSDENAKQEVAYEAEIAGLRKRISELRLEAATLEVSIETLNTIHAVSMLGYRINEFQTRSYDREPLVPLDKLQTYDIAHLQEMLRKAAMASDLKSNGGPTT